MDKDVRIKWLKKEIRYFKWIASDDDDSISFPAKKILTELRAELNNLLSTTA